MADAWLMVFTILYAFVAGTLSMELRTVVRMYFKDEYKEIRYVLKSDIIQLSTLIIIGLACSIVLAIAILI
ncbi:hypothetical protein [Mammaliicoccus sciuri]|uniref:hypothetical protein n=1 Tax=Mammaliicoccus sciuri TaxID=1296 RepID=UPI0034DD7336